MKLNLLTKGQYLKLKHECTGLMFMGTRLAEDESSRQPERRLNLAKFFRHEGTKMKKKKNKKYPPLSATLNVYVMLSAFK